MKHLVDVSWLAERLGARRLAVFEVVLYGGMPGQDDARETVDNLGIPGAVRFDLDGPFSRSDRGIHQMPPPKQFERALRALGLRAGDRVVVYDRDGRGIAAAPRAWWMLRGAGIRAAVLDGGLPAWVAAGHELGPVADRLETEGTVEVAWDLSRFCNAQWVERRVTKGDAVLDARPTVRFTGEEPDPREGVRAGHVPGAASLPLADLLEDGHMKPKRELQKLFAERGASKETPVTTMCGSGVSACALALAATLAGYPHVRVYDGSWAEWGHEDSGKPVATGQEPAGPAS